MVIESLKSQIENLQTQIDTEGICRPECGSGRGSNDELLERLESLQRQVDSCNAPGRSPNNPVDSCASLLAQNPNALSGYYWIGTERNSTRHYCNMTLSCGGITGGWTRVGDLDMTDGSQQCPSDLEERTDSGKRTCIKGRVVGCSSVTFPVALNYSKICGKIIGYQVGRPDAFRHGGRPSIERNYLDGISLTRGSPRNHVWTFAAALDEVSSSVGSICTCTNMGRVDTIPPDYVGDDYFCDTGSADVSQNRVFYGDNPLWDGSGCGLQSTCCSFNNPPWFHQQMPQPIKDDIEMRVCTNQGEEDIAVEIVSIFVQ